MHQLNRVSTPEFMAYASTVNLTFNQEKLNYFNQNYTNFNMTSYLTNKGWQFRDNQELFACRYI